MLITALRILRSVLVRVYCYSAYVFREYFVVIVAMPCWSTTRHTGKLGSLRLNVCIKLNIPKPAECFSTVHLFIINAKIVISLPTLPDGRSGGHTGSVPDATTLNRTEQRRKAHPHLFKPHIIKLLTIFSESDCQNTITKLITAHINSAKTSTLLTFL